MPTPQMISFRVEQLMSFRLFLAPAISAALLIGCPGDATKLGSDDATAVSDGEVFDVGLFTGTGTCVATSDQRDYPGLGITSYQIQGYSAGGQSSADPGAGANNVKGERSSGPCAMVGTTRSRTGSAGSWYTSNTDDVTVCLGDSTSSCANPSSSQCTACSYDSSTACSGMYKVTISSAPSACSEFDPVRYDITTTNGGARRRHSSADDCTAGSGRFHLMPISAIDRDGDGSFRAVYIPVQKSGTGVMTNAAWNTDLDLVDDNGQSLRVIKTGQWFSWDGSDQLVNASTVSLALSQTNDFSTGVVGGNAPIVVSEVSDANLWGMEADLTWTCGTGATSVTLAQGWQFRLSDIGCAPTQKFTLRRATSPTRVILEPYGNPNYARVVPTTTTIAGDAFSMDIGDLSFDATITSYSANSATLDIDSIRFDGTDYCTPGTYTFVAE